MEITLNIQRGKYLENTRLVYAVPCPIWMHAYRCVRVSMCTDLPTYMRMEGKLDRQLPHLCTYLSFSNCYDTAPGPRQLAKENVESGNLQFRRIRICNDSAVQQADVA